MLGVAERTLLWLLVALAGAASASPAAGASQRDGAEETPPWLFDPSRVHEIDMTLSDEAYAELMANPDEYVEGEFALSADGDDYGPVDVEIKLKGSASFRNLNGKAAFKLKFGERFLGLKKLTLNNMVQDRSMVHEVLAYEMFRGALVAAPRTGYAYVRLNGEDYGLYLNAETLDKIALERWFTSTGHLYEGEKGADVTPEAVDMLQVDEGDEDDRADLQALTAALATPAPNDLGAHLEGLADLDQMARMWAVERYIGHWDGYTGAPAPNRHPNNYYLHSSADGLFSMLPWGTDSTFGRRVVFDAPGGVLFNACLADPACREKYLEYLFVMPALARELRLGTLVAELASQLEEWQQRDPRKEHSMEQIAAEAAATQSFIAQRPGDLADPNYWLPRSNPPPRSDTRPPGTRITDAPPRMAKTARRRARVRFAFESTELGSSFECRLDRGRWRPCRSPLRLKVSPGWHVLRVRAQDLAGNVDPSPARHRWLVVRKRG